MNFTDENQIDDMLDRIARLGSDDAALSDADIEALLDNPDAIEAFRQLGALQSGTRKALQPDVPDVDAEWQRLQQRLEGDGHRARTVAIGGWHKWAAIAACAAAIVAVVALVWPTGSAPTEATGSYVAFVKQTAPQDIVLTIGKPDAPLGQGRDEINLSDRQQQQKTGTTLSEAGRLVLDYNHAAQQGHRISVEQEQNTVTIPQGKEFQIVFADGTRVWLHAESRLVYPSRFTGSERRVYLEGEAYFDVAKDPAHPFVIFTDQLEARVLGTELNVSCYPGQESHVALITGRVQVSSGETEPVTLRPGQGTTLTDAGFETAEENMDPYLNWRKGYIYFDEAPLVEVVTELGRWYNIDVIIENRELMERHVRFFFPRNEPIDRAIELLNTFHEFHAVIQDGRLVIKDL